MTTPELLADVLTMNLNMVNMTLADFSDADMLARPCPGANHPAWQLGHIIVAETGMISAVKPGAAAELPAGFADKFNKETAKSESPSAFPGKAALLEQFAKTRAATIKWAKSLTPADMAKPTPEPMSRFVPTVGHLAVRIPEHTAMHIGQFQVARRKLGKPLLF